VVIAEFYHLSGAVTLARGLAGFRTLL